MRTGVDLVTVSIRAVGFVALLSALSLAAAGAMAQENAKPYKPPGALPWDLVKNCPPGHRIEYTLPATTVYVDAHWLSRIEISHLYDAYGVTCPSGPVKLSTLEFGTAALRVLDIRTGLGRELLRLRVGGDPSALKSPVVTMPPADRKRVPPPSAPWIEDLNLAPPFKGVFGPGTKVPDSRAYRIHYPKAPDSSEATVDISCGGHDPKILRVCRTLGPYAYDGVTVTYTVSQKHLPIPEGAQITSTDPATEPGALLQFDSRFRSWLTTLEKKS